MKIGWGRLRGPPDALASPVSCFSCLPALSENFRPCRGRCDGSRASVTFSEASTPPRPPPGREPPMRACAGPGGAGANAPPGRVPRLTCQQGHRGDQHRKQGDQGRGGQRGPGALLLQARTARPAHGATALAHRRSAVRANQSVIGHAPSSFLPHRLVGVGGGIAHVLTAQERVPSGRPAAPALCSDNAQGDATVPLHCASFPGERCGPSYCAPSFSGFTPPGRVPAGRPPESCRRAP